LAILGGGSGSEHAIAVAQDYGLDPAMGNEYPSAAALAAFRHRDKGTGGTRPELPNMENMAVGVKPKSTNPRAQFNVLGAIADGLTIAAEGIRCAVAGNQILGPADTEIGRYGDTQVPSIVFGTDGDGVNDADEGNLFPTTSPTFYGTSDKMFVIAGNIMGLARDGSRPNMALPIKYAVDEFNLSSKTKARFGSNFDGLNDALEANTVYDSLGFAGSKAAPDNNAWILMRGNSLVNNYPMPADEVAGASLYDKFIDTTAPNPITPVISAVTTATLTGTCGLPLAGVAQVVVDVYVADPEGDAISTPQGKTYLGSFTDNSAADSDPAVGAFTFNIAGLGVNSGTKLTINANYLKADTGPTIASITRGGGNTTLTFAGGSAPYTITRASAVDGAYTSFFTASGSPAVFADAAGISFYRVGSMSGNAGGQTSPFSVSSAIP